jgi:Mrr N-terminal domain/SeqA protein N-terminal domain
MSPAVELDEDIYEYLKSQAEPFADTPNTVLRRLLQLDETSEAETQNSASNGATSREAGTRAKKRGGTRKSSGRTRAPSGTLLPEQRYELPLLRALIEAGGEAPYREVLESVGRALSEEFMPADHETLASGSVRWHSRLQFVRLRLVERGEMDREAPRGIWRITESGRQAALNRSAT